MYVEIMTWNSGGIMLFKVNLFLDNYQFNPNIMEQSGIIIMKRMISSIGISHDCRKSISANFLYLQASWMRAKKTKNSIDTNL